jgi:hypothetical protein
MFEYIEVEASTVKRRWWASEDPQSIRKQPDAYRGRLWRLALAEQILGELFEGWTKYCIASVGTNTATITYTEVDDENALDG